MNTENKRVAIRQSATNRPKKGARAARTGRKRQERARKGRSRRLRRPHRARGCVKKLWGLRHDRMSIKLHLVYMGVEARGGINTFTRVGPLQQHSTPAELHISHTHLTYHSPTLIHNVRNLWLPQLWHTSQQEILM